MNSANIWEENLIIAVLFEGKWAKSPEQFEITKNLAREISVLRTRFNSVILME